MSNDNLPAAFYVIPSKNIIARHINAQHLPYTVWYLSYAALGMAVSPVIKWQVVVGILAALYLGLGIAGHYLDLIKGDPLKQNIPARQLMTVAVVSVAIAVVIGISFIVSGMVSPWYLLVLATGVFLCFAYNLELPSFHGNIQFALWWGVWPALAGYFALTAEFRWVLVPVLAYSFLTAYVQRVLSWRARYIRRRMGPPPGRLTKEWLLAPVERSLMVLCAVMPLVVVMVWILR